MTKHLIYLAAGSARRFGSNKLLFPLEGKPLFRHGLDTLLRCAGERTDCALTVVSRYPQILQAARQAGARAVDSPQSVLGLSYTIHAALDALEPLEAEDFLLFCPADQPWLEAESVARLLDACRPGTAAGTAAFGARVGSPAFFSAALSPQLRALTGDQGGRTVLRALGSRCVQIPLSSSRELEDVDVPPDFQCNLHSLKE